MPGWGSGSCLPEGQLCGPEVPWPHAVLLCTFSHTQPRWAQCSALCVTLNCSSLKVFSHFFPVPSQHHQHQAAQALHLASPQQQSAIYHAGLAPTPPSMTPASNTQSPQNSFPTAQQTVFTIHPSHVQPAYTNPPHMAHVPQFWFKVSRKRQARDPPCGGSEVGFRRRKADLRWAARVPAPGADASSVSFLFTSPAWPQTCC